jgi:GntR family transcriptional regulator, transcriptional repressor for pyruvate dehydrogenase complex
VLESRRGSGTYVAPVDLEGVFDVRIRLEPLAAERAARERTDAEAARLVKAVDEMRTRLDDPAAFDAADAVFHSIVARASRSPVLISALDMLTEMALLSRAVTSMVDHLRTDSLNDVERICAAIERQHPKRAANAMERHIINVRTDFAGVIESDGARAVAVAKS